MVYLPTSCLGLGTSKQGTLNFLQDVAIGAQRYRFKNKKVRRHILLRRGSLQNTNLYDSLSDIKLVNQKNS